MSINPALCVCVHTGLLALTLLFVYVRVCVCVCVCVYRFKLMSTSSFKELDQSWRDALTWLHDDYYFNRQDDCWRASALRKLPALKVCVWACLFVCVAPGVGTVLACLARCHELWAACVCCQFA